MPDLSLKASHEYWNNFEDPMIYRVVSFMEGVEDWTLDGDPTLEAALTELSKELDDLDKVKLNDLSQEDRFIRIGCHLKSSRVLRLLQAIDSAQPGAASRVLIHAEEHSTRADDPAGIFLRRNIVFERLRLLARVFANDRLALVTKALEGEE